MSYAMMFATCVGCGTVFGFNPLRVPSIRIQDRREPLCHTCAQILYDHQVKEGMDPPPIHEDAYEPIHESELP